MDAIFEYHFFHNRALVKVNLETLMMSTNLVRVLAILLFIGALFFGWYGYLNSKIPVAATPAPVVKVPQIMTMRNIVAGEKLSEADLAVAQVTQFNSLGFSSITQVVGKVVNQDIPANTPMLSNYIQQFGPAAQLLKADERGVAIKVDEVAGAGGFIKPGDYVDVLLFANDDREMKRKSIAQVVLSNLRVISFGEAIQESAEVKAQTNANSVSGLDGINATKADKPNNATRSAVLAVNESDTTKLMLAASIGQLRLALRGEGPLVQAVQSQLPSNNKSAELNPAESANNVKASEKTNQYNSHFIKNDELLNDLGGYKDTVEKNTKQDVATSRKKTIARQTTKIIVHNGDKTESVVLNNTAVKGR